MTDPVSAPVLSVFSIRVRQACVTPLLRCWRGDSAHSLSYWFQNLD